MQALVLNCGRTTPPTERRGGGSARTRPITSREAGLKWASDLGVMPIPSTSKHGEAVVMGCGLTTPQTQHGWRHDIHTVAIYAIATRVKMHVNGCWRYPLFRCRWWLHWKRTVGTQPCEPNILASYQLPYRRYGDGNPGCSQTQWRFLSAIQSISMPMIPIQGTAYGMWAHNTSNGTTWSSAIPSILMHTVSLTGHSNAYIGTNLIGDPVVIGDTIFFDGWWT